MTRKLTLGKLRGLQQISDAHGLFAMCAMDHRGSMQRMINKADPKQVTADTLVEYKRDLTKILGPESTAVLLDPIYGAAQAISSGALSGNTGLLVSLEETGYESDAQGRVTTLLPDWSVEKIKRMGAAAVKILLYYRPDLAENAARQREVTRRVADDCARADIPFLLEPIAYPVSTVERDPTIFARSKPGLVADSARDLTPLGVDVLKAEFPANMRYEQDEGRLRAFCEQLNAASDAPWILLSAGVTFEEFARQVKIACQARASGFLGGRAIWEEAMHMPNAPERRKWLATVAADRMRQLHDIASEYGQPWWKKWAASVVELTEVGPEWYRQY
jgi:tagatose 1,6-diphosphate aldolase